MSIMSYKEIRAKLLESDDPKGWKYSIGEQMRDSLTNEQAAILAYHYYSRNPTGLYLYFMEVMGPVIEKTMDFEIERYKERNDITYGLDDCSAYKEDRDINPEKYT